jgi:uncharacterized damage-inducible protein DinB
MSEPWLSGPIEGVDPLLAPVLYTFEQTRQDLAAATADLTTEELWARPGGGGSVGFHLRHAGGAAERLSTYLRGQQLSESQLAAGKAESEPGASRDELLARLGEQLAGVEAYIRTLDTATLAEARGVGRKMLPTTVIGLIVHIAEHTFRHAGQAVTTAKFVRSMRGAS